MPRRAGAEEARYICPQCFTVHYQNDVLFAAGRPSGICDTRQAAHRYALEARTAFAQWCERGETAALLNWRALPQSRRQWKDSVVTAVQDFDGSWTGQRVCPHCHLPLSPFCPVVIGWQGVRMDNTAAFDLLQCAAEADAGHWRVRRDNSLPLRYDYLLDSSETAVLGVPVALEYVMGDSGWDYRRRCCESASGAVVRLRLQVEEDGSVDDVDALRTLEALLEICGYSGLELKMSAVFLLEGLEDQPDTIEFFQRECPQLVRKIQYDFEDSYFAVGLYGHPEMAAQAMEWLSGHISRLNTEG